MSEVIINVLQKRLQVVLFLLRLVMIFALSIISFADIDRSTPAINVFPVYLVDTSKYVFYMGLVWAVIALFEILVLIKAINTKVLFFCFDMKITYIFLYRCLLAGLMPIYILLKLLVLHAPFYPMDLVAVLCFPLILIAVSVCENYDE